MTTYTHAIHIADVHIRTGNEELSRYTEYATAFSQLFIQLSQHDAVKNETALFVVCGDIFHNKHKLEAYSVQLWNALMRGLTAIGPTFVICGNHDYRQEQPNAPDLIDVLRSSWGQSKYPCKYLDATGTHAFANVIFGVVSIKDTLSAQSTCGMNDELPPFPVAPNAPAVRIALFHGTITQSALPNGQIVPAGKGYALEWFKGYDILMLGDNHKQQVNLSSWGMPWAYPGSLIQQDYGEPVYGHGYILWDLKERTATPFHVYNPYGRIRARLTPDGDIEVRTHSRYAPLAHEVQAKEFPKSPIVQILGNAGDEVHIQRAFSAHNIAPIYIQTTTAIARDGAALTESNYIDVNEISQLNHPSRWMEYIRQGDPELADAVAEEQWFEQPDKIMIDMPANIPADLAAAVEVARSTMQVRLDAKTAARDMDALPPVKVSLKHMSWDWTFSYGGCNWFNFETLEGNITILNGPNASGKSAFIDTLCIGLFGEPNPNRHGNTPRKVMMSNNFIHKQRPTGKLDTMHVAIILEVDSGTKTERYEIVRRYNVQGDKADAKVLAAEIHRLTAEGDGTLARTLVHSGPTLVNDWVDRHCGRIEDVLKTSIVTQMDNHNFFTAKADDQKKIIDHAVNLKTLQWFGNFVHDALLAYNRLLTKLSQTINVYEGAASAVGADNNLSEEDLDNYRRERDELVATIATLEASRDQLVAKAGAFLNDPPGNTQEYWVSMMSKDARTLMRDDEYAACKNRLTVLSYMLAGEDADLVDEDTGPVGHEEEQRLSHRYDALVEQTHSPQRDLDVIAVEMQGVAEWFDSFPEWRDDVEKGRGVHTTATEELAAVEEEYHQWASSGLGDVVTEDAGSGDADWRKRRAAYDTLHAKCAALGELRSAEHKNKWQAEKAMYDAKQQAAVANNWTSKDECKKSAQLTRDYMDARRERVRELAALSLTHAKATADVAVYPDWSQARDEWEAEKASMSALRLQDLDAELARVRELDAKIRDAEHTIAHFNADTHAEWLAKSEKVRSKRWTTEGVEQRLEEIDAQLFDHAILVKEAAAIEAELSKIQDCPFNAACDACRVNTGHIHARRKELAGRVADARDRIAATDVPALQKRRRIYKVALETVAYVEAQREAMERGADEVARAKAALTDCEGARKRLPPLADLAARRDALAVFLAKEQATDERFARLQAAAAVVTECAKKMAKLSRAIERMETEDSLAETLAFWEEGAETRAFVEGRAEYMQREEAAWAQQDVLASLDVKLQAAKLAFHRAWNNAGKNIKERLSALQGRVAHAERFVREYASVKRRKEALECEDKAQRQYVAWKAELACAEAAMHRVRQRERRAIEARVAAHDMATRAGRAVAWYEYQSVRQALAIAQQRRTELASRIDQYDNVTAAHAKMAGQQATLNALLRLWTRRRDILAKLDDRLVGERGYSGGTDTYKEWVYVKHVIPMIERRVNRFLTDIDTIQVRIQYQSKMLLFFVKDRGNECSYAASSGYQQFIVGLAMRQALATIGSAGNNLQHMFIDEGFTTCDNVNIEKVRDMLTLLIGMGRYKSILLVTHLDSVKDTIPHKVQIQREGAFSRLRYGTQYPTFVGVRRPAVRGGTRAK